jgi:hypothetical protein
MVKTTSLTTAAINALTTGDSSILYNNQSRDLVLYSGSIGFIQSSVFNLEINTVNGECLILKNNSSLTNYVNFNVSNQGQLNIITNGNNKIVNIQHHNGLTSGLSLNNILILSTATELNKLSGVTASTTELNYVDTTPGVVEASKALIADSNRDITNIRNLQTENLTVNGTLVTANATELNYNDIGTIGTAEPAKALVVDMNKDITGINNLSSTNLSTNSLTLNGTQIMLTGSELNVLDGITATTSELNVLDGITATTSELNKLHGVTATTNEINYVETTAGTAHASKALIVDSSRDITNIHNLSATNLTATENITGTLATASQPNITSVGTLTSLLSSGAVNITNSTTSTTTSTGALIVTGGVGIGGALNIGGSISATGNITGTLATASQPNITSVGTLTNLSVSGNINGTLATASQPNITSVGTLTNLSVSGNINGTLATASQPNITSVGTLTSLSVSGNITGTLATASQPNITSVGILTSLTSSGAVNITNSTASTTTSTGALRVTGGVGIGGALNIGGSISATGNITGTLATASQPNITLVGILTSLTSSGAVNITNSTASTSTSTGALIVTGGVGIGGALNIGGSISATGNITGTLATASQPNITSVGTLTSLLSSGVVNITNSTASTTTSTGALIVTGGVGIGGALNIGGILTSNTRYVINKSSSGDIFSSTVGTHIFRIDQPSTASNVLIGTTTATGQGLTLTTQNFSRLIISSGGDVSITNSTASTTSSTGALRVTGGVGIGGALNIGGAISSNDNISGIRIRASALNTAASIIGNWDDSGYWGLGENGSTNGVRLGLCSWDGTWTTGRANLLVNTLFYNGSLTSDSDYRLKTDIIPLSYGLTEILNLNPKKYKLLSDEKIYYGLIAHEVQEQLPELVNGQKDAINSNNEPMYQGIDYVKITPVLINAIQELNAKNDINNINLNNKIEELKNENSLLKEQIEIIKNKLNIN